MLREAGLVEVRRDQQRRSYGLSGDALPPVDAWLAPYRQIWEQRFDALHTEIARGRRAARRKDQP